MGQNIATNKKAFFDYHIEEQFEAGLVLKGSEVKALILDLYIVTDTEFLMLSHLHTIFMS